MMEELMRSVRIDEELMRSVRIVAGDDNFG